MNLVDTFDVERLIFKCFCKIFLPEAPLFLEIAPGTVVFRTFRCGDDVKILCGCLPAKTLVAGVTGRQKEYLLTKGTQDVTIIIE